MRHIYSLIIGMLLAAMVALPAMAAPYAAPKVFSYRDPMLSSDMNDINAAISAACGTASVTPAQLATGAAIANVGAGGVTAINLAYSNSTTWDTMPVKMYGGYYTGDSTAVRRISCGGIRPMRVEVTTMMLTGNYKYTVDNRWDTTSCFVEWNTVRAFSDTSTSYFGDIRITKGDTEFVLYHNNATAMSPNYLAMKYAYTVWGY
jgi:hypothetical protein